MLIKINNISATVIIIAIIIIRNLAFYYFPKKIFVVLWSMVVIRLLFPFYFFIPNNKIYNFTNNLKQLEENIITNLNLTYIIKFGSLAGSVFIFTVIVFLHLCACKDYQTALPINDKFIQQWLNQNTKESKLRIRKLDSINSAMTYGVFNPTILLPSYIDFEDTKTLNLVLFHEYTHIKNCDILKRWLLVVCLSIYWYNPIIWVFYFFAKQDIELVCDEKVLSLLGGDFRFLYARTLVSLRTIGSTITPVNYFAKK